ncbi:tRNA (adenosine(37)-N6)-threonylcarbamoyltransferase complex ATPase subunit type 1 TsaE, partial [Enterococcus faecalis]|nr:tRNA (adenosine(37)-N6)-threonylcarbamoyltransferase complex ATPase subunit type 1 TsaE [Enterococcus faecalis]
FLEIFLKKDSQEAEKGVLEFRGTGPLAEERIAGILKTGEAREYD